MILQQRRPHRSNFKQNTHHASHLQVRMHRAEKQTTHGMCIPVQWPPVKLKRKLCPHTASAKPPAWLCPYYQRLRPKLQARKKRKKQKLGNSKSPNHHMITNATHTAVRAPAFSPPSAKVPWALCAALPARHGIRSTPAPDALRLLQSFPGHLDK